MDTWDWEPVKEIIRTQNTTQEWVAQKSNIPFNTFKGWISKGIEPRIGDAAKIAETLGVSLDILAGREFLVPSGKPQSLDHFAVASLVSQKVSAGAGQAVLEDVVLADDGQPYLGYTSDELIRRAPYPQSWGKGLLAIEVLGDSMTGVQIFDGDIVYFKPGEVRADGIYVIQINGSVFVKRVSFDQINRRIIITSENVKYPQVTEPLDSQAVTILGKVKGWLHEHPY